MFPIASVSPTVVPIDFNNVPLDCVLDTLSALVKFDPHVVKRAQSVQLPLWDIVDVGHIANHHNDFEGMSVVYSPAMMGEIYTMQSDEVMFAVLEFIQTNHVLKHTSPLTWEVAEEYQMGYDDYDCLPDLQEAFYRWDAQRQKAVIASQLPDHDPLPRKTHKI